MIARRPWVRSTAFALALALASAPAAAQTIQYAATMNGLSESPSNLSPGVGFGTFTLTDNRFLAMNVTFSGLTGTTTASHIHCCTALPFAGTAGVATELPSFDGFPLGVTGGTFVRTIDLSLASTYNPAFLNNATNMGNLALTQAAFINGLNNGTSYFNIHTTTFGGGEIRGFITTVPEPGTVLLVASGLFVVGVVARKKTRQE